MFVDWEKIKVFIKPGYTDMRKQINGLSVIVQEDFNVGLFSESMFLFCSKNRKRLKILYWDKNGFCLWLKRLEQDKFPWPGNEKEVKEITKKQLKMLLTGIDFFHKHQVIYYKNV